MKIRKANEKDTAAVAQIYSDIHTEEEAGKVSIGWIRNVYPTISTAETALKRGDLFVLEDQGKIVGAAIINQQQVDVYKGADWKDDAADDKVMVLHTLVISPKESGRGYGKAFVAYYEEYARSKNCPYLRMDTNVKNLSARSLYKKLGYSEIGIVPCIFNGIPDVDMVLLEKYLV